MRFVCLMLLFTTCLPATHSLLGAACNEATDPCPEPLTCLYGRCTDMVPEDILLLDSGFEGGVIDPWTGRLTIVSTKHSGDAGVRAAGTDGSGPAAETKHDKIPAVIGLHCARAWVMHGQGTAPITLQLRLFSPAGVLLATSAAPAFSIPDGGREWGLLTTELFLDGGQPGNISVGIESPAPPPADLFVDDVTLVRTAKPGCP